MPQLVNLYEAKTHLSSLVDRAANGELIIIARNNRPVATLQPYSGGASSGFIGLFKDAYTVPSDFDSSSIDELNALFEGDAPNGSMGKESSWRSFCWTPTSCYSPATAR
ncbi:MAG: type II toxin-antitoxin system prevent-host-death family antitoxin [Actinomycetia bacterium]|nr:type II toxin-antitoxin system prevent-host-death family antitoxin [Actinomycetes bacterium]